MKYGLVGSFKLTIAGKHLIKYIYIKTAQKDFIIYI
jgi:hypothetical protein